jgi:DNA-nicking Smr family endonuclease
MKRPLSEEEKALWKQLTQGIRQINAQNVSPPHQADPVKSKKFKNQLREKRENQALHFAKTVGTPKNCPLEKIPSRKLREIKPEARLDLHGYTLEKAEYALEKFFSQCFLEGKKYVLVVTGHGEGILKRYLPQWLERKTSWIVGYGEAPQSFGGNGALFVHIRKIKV